MASTRSAGWARPRRLSLLALLTLLALAPAAGALPGAPPASQAAPAPWDGAPFAADPAAIARAAERAGDAASPAVVLLAEARVSFDDAGRSITVRRLVYRIQSAQAGESWSQIEEVWSPWHQARPQIRARVVTPDGAPHPLAAAALVESPVRDEDDRIFGDQRVLRAPLPAAGPGAVVEQEVTIEDTAPFFDRGTARRMPLAWGVPVRLSRLAIDAPAALPLRWAARRLPDGGAREAVAGGRRQVRFEYRDLAAIREIEPDLPPDVPRFPHVVFSTGRAWIDVAARYAEIVDGRLRGADVSALLGAAGPPLPRRERIEELLARVRKAVRYTGVELGQASLVPRAPAEILASGYGDCKDQATVLIALLRAAGIPAHVALLSAGPGEDVEASLPGIGQFDHAIVYVPGEPALWIDPTHPYARAGELPEGDQGRLALVASPATAALLRTPEAEAAANRTVQEISIELADLGPARLAIDIGWSGEPERTARAELARLDPEASRKLAKAYVASDAFRGKDLASMEHTDPADLSRPFHLRLAAKQAERGQTDLLTAAVGIPLVAVAGALPDAITEEGEEEGGDRPRQGDYLLSPSVREARYRIVPPPGFAPAPLPPALTRAVGTATLSAEYRAEAGGVVTATLRFDAGRRRLSPKEFAAFRAAYRELAQERPVLVRFEQVGEAHAAAGRTREALDEFRRLSAAAPQKALPRCRLARALLAGGMGEAARREAERAVALEPGSATAQATLGWILQHDALGRRFGRGFDRARALAAYRKAKQLDPTDWAARGDLAILLEHDARGVRYGPKADLAQAIAEYQAIRSESKREELTDNLLIDLLRAGRTGEMKELLAKLPDSAQRSTLALVAAALLDGPEAAAREAAARLSDPAARVQELRGAGGTLTILRRYPEAAALFAAAAKESPNAADLLSTVEVLKKARRHEELALPRDQPETPVLRFLLLVMVEGADPKEAAGLLSRSAIHGHAVGPAMAEARSQIGATMAREGLPADAIADLSLALLRTTREGDDARGYRIQAFSHGANAPNMVAFVGREEGTFRIAGFASAPDSLGAEALRRLAAKDGAGARQWLDWARAEAPAARGEDPLAGSPILRLWGKGAPAGDEAARCAAASLMAQGKEWGAEAEPIVVRCRDAEGDAARRAAYDLALAWGYGESDRYPELLAAARRLRAAHPDSDRALRFELGALGGMRRWDEVATVAGERLAKDPDDVSAELSLAEAEMHGGRFDEMERRVERLLARGKATPIALNNLAWSALFRGKVRDADLETARRAAELGGYKSAPALHTLAALYAEVGKTAEAYKVILQSIDVRGGEPRPEDWYVFGRLAEAYGLPAEARADYARVTEGQTQKSDPTSVYKLARMRLAALAAAPSR